MIAIGRATRQGVGSGLMPAYFPNWCFQRAPTNGAGAAPRAFLGGGHSLELTHRAITIVADVRLDVCDGAHETFVMKKCRGQSTGLFRAREANRSPLALREVARCGTDP